MPWERGGNKVSGKGSGGAGKGIPVSPKEEKTNRREWAEYKASEKFRSGNALPPLRKLKQTGLLPSNGLGKCLKESPLHAPEAEEAGSGGERVLQENGAPRKETLRQADATQKN